MSINDLKLFLRNNNLNDDEIEEIINIIKDILNHPEFQIRLTDKYLHHGKTTLGIHILEDVILTYKYAKKTNKNIRIDLAIKIAMFHDLYCEPWQNNELAKNNSFYNKHGFRHPVEAVINAYTWFKNDFNNIDDASIIIDSIIHHMYPLPVIIMDGIENRELNNYLEFKKMPKNVKDIIIKSTNRNRFLKLSWSKSKYLEGRIVSRADKKASLKEFNNINSVLALITGKNNTIK